MANDDKNPTTLAAFRPAATWVEEPSLDRIPRHVRKLIDAHEEIRSTPSIGSRDHAYMARQLVQVTLPHRNPGNVDMWSRTNGNFTLAIRPAWDYANNKVLGYPYGSIPRLILFWITTEALRTKSRTLDLGSSLAAFMRALGLDPSRGGKRSDARRLHQQIHRTFRSQISFHQKHEHGQVHGERWLNMPIVEEQQMFWDIKNECQASLFDNYIELGERFAEAIQANPVPVDVRALRALKSSPLALDLYAWSAYRTYRVTIKGRDVFVPWRSLHQQIGNHYRESKDFKRYAKAALHKVRLVYPDLKIEDVDGGVIIHPSLPAIRPRS